MPLFSFNTQPPEGGWGYNLDIGGIYDEFQHTAARRRLGLQVDMAKQVRYVSTHSRPKAAGRTAEALPIR